MKANLYKVLLALLVYIMANPVSAYDFKVGSLFYNIIDNENHKLEVTYEKDISFNSYSANITIPAMVEYNGMTYDVVRIGENAFASSYNLRTVVLPNSITSIGNNAFHSCFLLKSITLPGELTDIEDGAFIFCEKLETIEIPKTVNTLGIGIFEGCYNLVNISVEEGNPIYDSRDDCNAIIETATNTLVVGCKNSFIPETVVTIGESAFRGSLLSYIEIPNSVTTIGDAAFSDCEELTDVDISNFVTSIGEAAFANSSIFSFVIPDGITIVKRGTFAQCENLSSVIIPSTVTSIEYGAFEQCGFKSITIPKSVEYIEWGAFGYCPNLESFICLVEQPFELEDNPLVSDILTPEELGITVKTILYVPKGTWEKYWQTPRWKDFFYDIRELDENGNPTEISQPTLTTTDETPFYNLNGQRLSKPVKGVNIIEGKKVVVK